MNLVEQKLFKLKRKEKGKTLSRFFKTGKGEYGEGDIFWGITVPEQRKIAKQFLGLEFSELGSLLKSPVHECRLTALLILTYQYETATKNKDFKTKKSIYNFYVKNIKYVNNWDLVDTSAPTIVGEYLFDKNRDVLYKLAKSKKLWEKRIAIISTLYFIKQKDLADTLKISEILLNDKHDLIHKAVGWMLREVGKKDEKSLHTFLKKHIKDIPRTTLRYAIEKLSADFRSFYMNHS